MQTNDRQTMQTNDRQTIDPQVMQTNDPQAPEANDPLQRDDIQGFLLSAYAHLPFAAFLLLSIGDPESARRWLADFSGTVTNATAKDPHRSVNIALTRDGLTRLGLPQHVLATFAFAFNEGMVDPHRSRILGDVGANDPQRWDWGAHGSIDVLVMLYGVDDATVDSLVADIEPGMSAASLTVGRTFRSQTDPQGREQFGFKDGTGQPVIAGSGNRQHQFARTGHATELPPGEFLLGHPNLYDLPSESPTVAPADDPAGILGASRDLGYNGTYLVFRQLEQDVPRFWNFVDTQAALLGMSPIDLASKFVGRWPNGAPLVLTDEPDSEKLIDANNFTYEGDDPNGLRCPLGAHIRRANPRDVNGLDPKTKLPLANLHRIMRRGRSYGKRIDDPTAGPDEKRGLHFMCFNADLERQFELVQQAWINNPIFSGLSAEVDPLVGNIARGDGTFTVQETPLRRRVDAMQQFVTVRGGSYFFVPSFRALRFLSRLGEGDTFSRPPSTSPTAT